MRTLSEVSGIGFELIIKTKNDSFGGHQVGRFYFLMAAKRVVFVIVDNCTNRISLKNEDTLQFLISTTTQFTTTWDDSWYVFNIFMVSISYFYHIINTWY